MVRRNPLTQNVDELIQILGRMEGASGRESRQDGVSGVLAALGGARW